MQIYLRSENCVFTELIFLKCMKTEHYQWGKTADQGTSPGACHHPTSICPCPRAKVLGADCGWMELFRNRCRQLQGSHQQWKSLQCNQPALPLNSAKPFVGTSAALPCLVCPVPLGSCFLLFAKHALLCGKCCRSGMMPESFSRWAKMFYSDKERAPDAKISTLKKKDGEYLVEWKYPSLSQGQ